MNHVPQPPTHPPRPHPESTRRARSLRCTLAKILGGSRADWSNSGGPWHCRFRSITAWCMSPTGSAPTRSIAMCSAPSWCGGRTAGPIDSANVQLNLHGPGFRPGRGGAAAGRSRATAICASNGADRSRMPSPISGAAVWRSMPDRCSGSAPGAGTSVYFRDPDGSLLEFISYRSDDASGEITHDDHP